MIVVLLGKDDKRTPRKLKKWFKRWIAKSYDDKKVKFKKR